MAENGRVVHLVDDDEAIRRSASFMLRTSGFTVKTYPSGLPLIELGREIPAGVILMDVRMPETDGLAVQQALRAQGVFLPVIVMTGHGDIGIAVEAMKGGAIDFIEKPFEKASLVAALEEGFARIEQSGRRHARAEEAKARLKGLTARELEVLEGLVRGHPNKTIAYDLGISPRTVEIHRTNVMQKLDVPSLSDALRIAFAAGLGDDAEEGAPAA
ncbi:response regulator transcription factor [Allosphingosinicella deserti]|uniref:DNA-binding response regulator n=1 Tax=Allosphingosinicella deserti TaxID=2116704 RepID=A0A2P7QRM1_9SPHN|nr:response regulator [Sphingomonas deserti]PSJ40628.1 DNA-binding response regulator [Sphingomonas deserti]